MPTGVTEGGGTEAPDQVRELDQVQLRWLRFSSGNQRRVFSNGVKTSSDSLYKK